jgi:hypothetical protein
MGPKVPLLKLSLYSRQEVQVLLSFQGKCADDRVNSGSSIFCLIGYDEGRQILYCLRGMGVSNMLTCPLGCSFEQRAFNSLFMCLFPSLRYTIVQESGKVQSEMIQFE